MSPADPSSSFELLFLTRLTLLHVGRVGGFVGTTADGHAHADLMVFSG